MPLLTMRSVQNQNGVLISGDAADGSQIQVPDNSEKGDKEISVKLFSYQSLKCNSS